jgi:DNA-binding transcriptional regulator YhcF (GntR family)
MGMATEEIISGGMAPRQRKVVDAVLRHANLNGIEVGGRLPSIRDIASNTGIAHATVAKELKHLSDVGVVEARGRNGTILIKSLAKSPEQTIRRIIMVQHVEDPNAATLSTSLFEFELRSAVKTIAPGIDINSVYHTPQDGDELIDELIDYHYVYRGKPNNVIFMLGGCPAPIKRRFEKRGVPAVIMGGREEGISIPNVTVSIPTMIDQVIQLVRDADAFPALFVVDLDLLFGEQAEMARHFSSIAEKTKGTAHALTVLRTSSAPDMFHGQLTQALRSENRPRTIIARGDESATRIARVCMELGLLNQVRIISLESTALGQRFIPSITGLYRDLQGIMSSILDIAQRIARGEDMRGVRREAETIMVFRESFPNPYTVSSTPFLPMTGPRTGEQAS